MFAGLGHAICDVDTGEEMPLLAGDIVDAHINGCYKGTKGAAGELCGVFGNRVMGSLAVNGNTGVYGVMNAGNVLFREGNSSCAASGGENRPGANHLHCRWKGASVL